MKEPSLITEISFNENISSFRYYDNKPCISNIYPIFSIIAKEKPKKENSIEDFYNYNLSLWREKGIEYNSIKKRNINLEISKMEWKTNNSTRRKANYKRDLSVPKRYYKKTPKKEVEFYPIQGINTKRLGESLFTLKKSRFEAPNLHKNILANNHKFPKSKNILFRNEQRKISCTMNEQKLKSEIHKSLKTSIKLGKMSLSELNLITQDGSNLKEQNSKKKIIRIVLHNPKFNPNKIGRAHV